MSSTRAAAPSENPELGVRGSVAIPLSATDIVALAIISGTLSIAVELAAQEVSLLTPLVIGAVLLIALMIGRAAMSRISDSPATLSAPGEILIGVALLSFLILATIFLVGVSAGTAFLASCAFGAAAFAYNARRNRHDVWRTEHTVVLLGICVVSTIWSWRAIQAVPELQASGHFPVWSDFFQQAEEISQFARFPTLAAKNFVVYHYTSLMLPAVVRSLCPISALVAATALWTTFGYILMGLGAYALGTTLAGWLGGVAAVAAILLVPDAAHYGFRNARFDFHWFEQISTGGSYATGLACLALALGVVAYRRQCAQAFWLAAGVSVSVLVYRPYLFVPLSLAEALLLAGFWKSPRSWRRARVFATLGFVGAGAVLAAQYLPRAPHLFTTRPHPGRFIADSLVHGPTVYADGFREIAAIVPGPITLVIGLAYLLLAVSGCSIFTYFIGFHWCGRHRLLLTERWFPLALIAAFLLVVLFPPSEVAPHYDLMYSQFVLLYAVLAIWSACFAVLVATTYFPSRAAAAVIGVTCALIPVPFVLSPTVHSSMLFWAGPYVGTRLPREFIDGAAFLQAKVEPRQIIMAATNFQCGPLLALSERNLYFPEPCNRKSLSPETTRDDLAPVPGSSQQRLLQARNAEAFRTIAREVGIDWFFMYSSIPPPAWIPESAAWHQGNAYIVHADRDTK